MSGDDAVDGGESDPGAFELGIRVESAEGGEQFVAVGRVESDAIILDEELGELGVIDGVGWGGAEADNGPGGVGGVFPGVVKEVVEGNGDEVLVGVGPEAGFDDESDGSCGGAGLEFARDEIGQGGEVDGVEGDGCAGGFGEVEQADDDTVHAPGCLEDAVDVGRCGGAELGIGILGDEFGVAVDGSERGAEVMGDGVGEGFEFAVRGGEFRGSFLNSAFEFRLGGARGEFGLPESGDVMGQDSHLGFAGFGSDGEEPCDEVDAAAAGVVEFDGDFLELGGVLRSGCEGELESGEEVESGFLWHPIGDVRHVPFRLGAAGGPFEGGICLGDASAGVEGEDGVVGLGEELAESGFELCLAFELVVDGLGLGVDASLEGEDPDGAEDQDRAGDGEGLGDAVLGPPGGVLGFDQVIGAAEEQMESVGIAADVGIGDADAGDERLGSREEVGQFVVGGFAIEPGFEEGVVGAEDEDFGLAAVGLFGDGGLEFDEGGVEVSAGGLGDGGDDGVDDGSGGVTGPDIGIVEEVGEFAMGDETHDADVGSDGWVGAWDGMEPDFDGAGFVLEEDGVVRVSAPGDGAVDADLVFCAAGDSEFGDALDAEGFGRGVGGVVESGDFPGVRAEEVEFSRLPSGVCPHVPDSVDPNFGIDQVVDPGASVGTGDVDFDALVVGGQFDNEVVLGFIDGMDDAADGDPVSVESTGEEFLG